MQLRHDARHVDAPVVPDAAAARARRHLQPREALLADLVPADGPAGVAVAAGEDDAAVCVVAFVGGVAGSGEGRGGE